MADNRDAPDENGPPPPFFVYYNPIAHLLKLAAILAICVVLILIPFLVANVGADAGLVMLAIVAIFLIWAYLTYMRMRDRRPQVVIDTNGVYVRDWHSDVVPWEQIEFIAHSSSVRRSIVSALTRSRRGPYLLFKFSQMPQFVPSVPPPFSLLQKIWVDIELQEPTIMEYGLNAKATAILAVIQDHIAYWQRAGSAKGADMAVIPSNPGQ